MRTLIYMALFFLCFACPMVWANKETPNQIIENCIKRHGGWENFSKIERLYAKMDLRNVSQNADVESSCEEYFLKPHYLRIEVKSDPQPLSIIAWNGKECHQLIKDNIEKIEDEKQMQNMQEGVRFLRLMVLTDLIKDAKLSYEGYWKEAKSHIILREDTAGEKIKLFISESTYTLLGAEFYLQGSQVPFRVLFYKQKWMRVSDGKRLYLPTSTKLYRGKELFMSISLRKVNIDDAAFQNGVSFFTDLKEKRRTGQ